MQVEKLWTKTFITTSIVHFVLFLSMYLLLVTMASFTLVTYNTSVSTAGLVASIFVLGALIGRLLAGYYIQIISSKRILYFGIFIFILFSLFYFLNLNIYSLLFVRTLQGFGAGIATTATGTIVSQVIPSTRYGEGIGYFSMSVVLSTAIGPLIGVQLMNTFGYVSIFIFSTIVSTISLIISLLIEEPNVDKKKAAATFQNKKGWNLEKLFEKRAIPISLFILVTSIPYAAIISYMTAYAEKINLTEAGGYYFFVYALTIIISRPFIGKLMDKKGANIVIFPCLILFSLGLVVMSQAKTMFIFLLAAVIIGLGYGNLQSAAQALAVKLTPEHRMGLANSTFFIFLDLSISLSPMLLGMFISLIGYRNLYFSLALLVLISIYLYYVLHAKKEKEWLYRREKV